PRPEFHRIRSHRSLHAAAVLRLFIPPLAILLQTALEAQAAAERVAELAGKAEATAATLAAQRRREAERLAAQLDLERLLAERRKQEEAEKAKAAEAERAERLSGALARAKAALEAGRLEEAQAVLGPVATENPDHAEVASLLKIIAQRARIVKSAAAEDALWVARREWRRDPAAAVARLEALDVGDLPDPLSRRYSAPGRRPAPASAASAGSSSRSATRRTPAAAPSSRARAQTCRTRLSAPWAWVRAGSRAAPLASARSGGRARSARHSWRR
ncbi:MAG TPA: hypothetical protein VFE37_15200, partial [Chloroflexota bacterium]|nr:hypothetical protein [Chloroflexota bacterium]